MTAGDDDDDDGDDDDNDAGDKHADPHFFTDATQATSKMPARCSRACSCLRLPSFRLVAMSSMISMYDAVFFSRTPTTYLPFGSRT
eukprot:13242387-Alexandrium_andersonii.AAC.1